MARRRKNPDEFEALLLEIEDGRIRVLVQLGGAWREAFNVRGAGAGKRGFVMSKTVGVEALKRRRPDPDPDLN